MRYPLSSFFLRADVAHRSKAAHIARSSPHQVVGIHHTKRFDVDEILYQYCVKKLLVGYLSSTRGLDAAVQGGTMRPTASMVGMMAVILGALLAMHAGAQDRGPQVPLPDGPGKEMVQGTCAQCHGLNLITGSFGYTKEGWEDRLNTMITLPQDQLNSITTYLATHFPPRPAPAA